MRSIKKEWVANTDSVRRHFRKSLETQLNQDERFMMTANESLRDDCDQLLSKIGVNKSQIHKMLEFDSPDDGMATIDIVLSSEAAKRFIKYYKSDNKTKRWTVNTDWGALRFKEMESILTQKKFNDTNMNFVGDNSEYKPLNTRPASKTEKKIIIPHQQPKAKKEKRKLRGKRNTHTGKE